MRQPLTRMERIHPGIYRRGRRYVVRYRDGLGRQRQLTVGALKEARQLKARADIERRMGRERRGHEIATPAAAGSMSAEEPVDLKRRSLDLAGKQALVRLGGDR